MKQSVIAVAVAAILSLGASLQAGETPAVLKNVVKKQTLSTQQLTKVRGQGLLCCTPCVPACAPACAPKCAPTCAPACAPACTNASVNVNVDAQLCINVPCLASAHVNVPIAVHLGL